jgi:hypothetical protein
MYGIRGTRTGVQQAIRLRRSRPMKHVSVDRQVGRNQQRIAIDERPPADNGRQMDDISEYGIARRIG